MLGQTLTDGEVCLLDCLHNARHELRQIMQRWDDRLTIENLSFAENYIEGRLSLICDIEVGVSRYHIQFSSLPNNKVNELKAITSLVFGTCPNKSGDRGDGDQQLMFVHDVEVVKCAQGVIPSLVRFYRIDDNVDDGTGRSLYFPAIDGFYKFVTRVPKVELRLPVGCVSSQGDDLVSHQVQGRAQVVNCIANNQGNFTGHLLSGLELQDIISTIRVSLDVKTIEVRLEKCQENALKLIDVLVGPFDL